MNIKLNAILTLAAILAALAATRAQTNVQGGDHDNYHIFDGKGKETLNTNFNNHVYTITRMGNVTTALCVDNKKIDPADWSKYDSVVNRIFRQVRVDEAQAETDRAQGERDRAQAEVDRRQAAHDQEQSVRDREQAVRDQEQAAHDQEQAARDREQAVRDREQAEEDRRQAAEDRENLHRLISLHVDKKLIADAASLKNLVLTDDELLVNGKKVSPEIHKEVKENYSRWAHRGLSVGDGCNCGVSIHFHTVSNP